MYLLQFALLYSLFYLAYRFGLRKTGQLTANRWYLLGCYAFALLLPLLPWPSLNLLPESATNIVSYVQTDVATPSIEANPQLIESTVKPELVTVAADSAFSWKNSLIAVYLLGVLCFLLRYGLQLWSLQKLIARSSPLSDHRWQGRARLLDKARQKNLAFTYGPCFYVSLNLLTSPDAEAILEHEFAHARQRHTTDLTISELFTALLWWHPIAWLHRRDLRLNLEFLADRAVLDTGHSPKNYQLSLLRFCESLVAQPALTFSQSPLKTRIIMMKSKKRSATNYLALLVAVLVAGGLVTACSSKEIAAPVVDNSEVPFTQTFLGQEGWEQAYRLLVNKYPNHQVEYFINGSLVENDTIPQSHYLKEVTFYANIDAPNLVTISLSTLSTKWNSEHGLLISEEKFRLKLQDDMDWTLSLIKKGQEPSASFMTGFTDDPDIYQTAFDYLKEEYPIAGTTFYLDGEPSDIDAVKTPSETVRSIVIGFSNDDMSKVIFHVITNENDEKITPF